MFIHTVQQGDTLYEVAMRYGLPLQQLIEENQLRYPDRLVPGQALVIGAERPVISVRRGDTLFAIARRYGITVEELVSFNPWAAAGLRIGRQLQIPLRDPLPYHGTIEANGYAYPTITEEVLDETLPYLTYLSAFSYRAGANGSLLPPSADWMVEAAHDEDTAPILVLTNIGDAGAFDTALAHSLLGDDAARDRLIATLVETASAEGYRGVDVDFEYIRAEDREAYNSFLQALSQALHEAGLLLMTAVAPKTSDEQQGTLYEGHDYAAHGRYADRVTLMTYEWGYKFGPPMAVAPIDRVEQVVAYAAGVIPPEKLLLGIPNYAYDWTLPYTRERGAEVLTNPEAVDRAAEHWAQIRFDEAAQTPFYRYTDLDGAAHEVWFEDARSIRAKLDLAHRYGLAGVSYWNVNHFFSQGLLVHGAMFDRAVL